MDTFDLKWILLVDDEEDMRDVLRMAIQKRADEAGMNLHIVEAVDGFDALEKASAREFDCIITDLKMPQYTGDQFVASIQSHPLNVNTPIIVVSAFISDEFKSFASTFEHIRYVEKPCAGDDVAIATLNELRFGNKEERVALHLLKPLVRALQNYLKESEGLGSQLKSAYVKKHDQELNGNIHCVLALGSQLSRAFLCMSFDSSFLRKQVQNRDKEAISVHQHRMLEEAKVIVHGTLAHAMAAIKICMGGNPHLLGLSIVSKSDKETFAFDQLSQTICISLPIQTPQGEITLRAYSNKDFPSSLRSNAA